MEREEEQDKLDLPQQMAEGKVQGPQQGQWQPTSTVHTVTKQDLLVKPLVHDCPAQSSPSRDHKARRETGQACAQEQLWGVMLAAQEGTVTMLLGKWPAVLMKLKLHVTSDPNKREGM